jgi:hypothetical protein
MTNHDKNEIFDYLIAEHIASNLGPLGNFLVNLVWAGYYLLIAAFGVGCLFGAFDALLS